MAPPETTPPPADQPDPEPDSPAPGTAAPALPGLPRPEYSPSVPLRVVRLLIRPSFRSLTGLVTHADRDGLVLWLEEPLLAGAVLALEIKGLERGQTNIRSATVTHCDRREDHTWLVGCWLATSLTDRELLYLRGGRLPSAPP